MFQIILFILKILGILLLVVLAVFLLILAAVLCAPVRYRAQGSFHESMTGAVKATWLWPLVSVRVFYEQEPGFAVRLFGIPILKSGKKSREEESADAAVNGAPEGETGWLEETDAGPAWEEETGGDAFWDPMDADAGDDMILSAQELGGGGDSEDAEEADVQESPDGGRAAKKKKKRRKKEKKKKAPGDGDAQKVFFDRLTETFHSLKDKVLELKDKKDRLTAFLTDEENRKTFCLIKRQLIHILKHLIPTRLKGNLVFGLEDPYAMGQALSAAAFFYPLYGRSLILNPVFDETVIEGDVQIRGRIRAGVFALAALRILINRNFRRQLKRIIKGK